MDTSLIQRLSNNPELLTHIVSLINSISVGSADGFDDIHSTTTTADSDLKNGRNPVTDNNTTGTTSHVPKLVTPGLRLYHRHVGGTSLPYDGWMQVVDLPTPKPNHHWVCCYDDKTNNKCRTIPGYDSWNGLKQTSFDSTQCILFHDDDESNPQGVYHFTPKIRLISIQKSGKNDQNFRAFWPPRSGPPEVALRLRSFPRGSPPQAIFF